MKRILDSTPIDTFDKRSRLTSEALARHTAALEGQNSMVLPNSNLIAPTPSVPSGPSELPKVLQGSEMRKGKWTQEEEAYANRIIYDFEEGLLDIPPRTHLRYYLALVLHCEQMRISKKYRGMQKVGKQIYVPMPNTTPDHAALLAQSRLEREYLRQRWYQRLFDIEAGGTIANPKQRPFDLPEETTLPPRRSVMQQPILPMPPTHGRYTAPPMHLSRPLQQQQQSAAEEFDYQADWLKRADYALAYTSNHIEIINLIHEGKNILGVLDEVQRMNGRTAMPEYRSANDSATYRLFWALVGKEKEFRAQHEIFTERSYPQQPRRTQTSQQMQSNNLQRLPQDQIQAPSNYFPLVIPPPASKQMAEQQFEENMFLKIKPDPSESKEDKKEQVSLPAEEGHSNKEENSDEIVSLSVRTAPVISDAQRPSLSIASSSVPQSSTTTHSTIATTSSPLVATPHTMSSILSSAPAPLHLQHPSLLMPPPPPPPHRSMPSPYMAAPSYGYSSSMYGMPPSHMQHYAMQQHYRHTPAVHARLGKQSEYWQARNAQSQQRFPAQHHHTGPQPSLNEYIPTTLNNLDLQGLLSQSYASTPSRAVSNFQQEPKQ